jgi:hypothetical protein
MACTRKSFNRPKIFNLSFKKILGIKSNHKRSFMILKNNELRIKGNQTLTK